MSAIISQKLRIKEHDVLLTIHAPSDFKKTLGVLPTGVTISNQSKKYNQVHWFVRDKAQMEKEVEKILRLVKREVLLWIYYPKVTSKIQTDLTRDKGWDSLLKHGEMHWISLISFDETWSTFACRLKTKADAKRDSTPKERPILAYIDPAKKIVRLPDDFAKQLKKNKGLETFFNALSFTNRKEYVEWIVTAKRDVTRTERIIGTMERLGKGWKNPGNR